MPLNLLIQATCAVHIPDQTEPIGTAWLVHQKGEEGYLLTAGHVLCKKNSPGFYDQVDVQFSPNIQQKASLGLIGFERERGVDFAVLELKHVPPNCKPLPISLKQSVTGACTVYGYGGTLGDPATGTGTFAGKVNRQADPRAALFRLNSLELNDEGFSGGAVYSHEEKKVVAIQTEGGQGRFGPASQTVLAMPLYRVAEYWKSLKHLASEEQTIPPPAPSLPSTLSPSVQAAIKTCFERNLPHILATWPIEQRHAAQQQLYALYRTFLMPPPDLARIQSVLAFFGRHPHRSSLRWLQLLLREPALQRLVRRSGEDVRSQYERVVFGRM